MKLFSRVVDIHSSMVLQNDLDTVMRWTKKWLLSLNIGKCKVLAMGKGAGSRDVVNWGMKKDSDDSGYLALSTVAGEGT